MKQQDYKLIENIKHLSVAKFEDLICDQKLSVLIISGKPDDITLIECWSNLYSQYLDILGDSEAMYIIKLESEVDVLNFKIKTAEAIIPVLEFFFVGQLVTTLKQLGFDTKTLTMGNPQFAHGLRKVTSRLAHMKLKLEEKEKELKQYYTDDTELDPQSLRQKLRQQRARLSKFQGYPIKPAKTMIPDYVAILKEYLSQPKFQKDGVEERENI